MKTKSSVASAIAAAVVAVLTLASCSDPSLNTALQNTVVFQYDHVANVRQFRFSTPVQGFNTAEPVDINGFWAVFVICSLDVQGNAINTFNYNSANFVVEYNGETFGAIQPFMVRFGASVNLNNASNTPQLAAAIASEVQRGPNTQPFPRGLFPALNYRVAILIPKSLRLYGGEQLTLKYVGQPSILTGRNQRPANIAVLGGSFGDTAPTFCRAPGNQ